MLSAVIEAGEDAAALAETLTALVPAAADGLLRDVVLAVRRPGREITAIAEALGCDIIEGDAAAGIAAARQPWVLRLQPGDRPEPGWPVEAMAFIERCERDGHRDRAGLFRLVLDGPGLAARLGQFLTNRARAGERPMLARREALAAGTRLRPTRLAIRLRRGR